MLLREDAAPKIAMLIASHQSPLESAGESVSDIPTVGKEMESALRAMQCMKDCCDFPPLCSLIRAGDGPAESVPIEEDETPSSAWPALGGTTASISRDQGDHVGDEGLGLPFEVLAHLRTSRGRVVIGGYIARVPQTAWGIW